MFKRMKRFSTGFGVGAIVVAACNMVVNFTYAPVFTFSFLLLMGNVTALVLGVALFLKEVFGKE